MSPRDSAILPRCGRADEIAEVVRADEIAAVVRADEIAEVVRSDVDFGRRHS